MLTQGFRIAAVALFTAGAARTTQAQPPQSSPAARPAVPAVTSADVRFMQEMLGHHQQAVEMVALLRSRTRNPSMRMLAERIQVSQADEMTMMRRWLAERGAGGADASGHAMASHDTTMHAGHAMPAKPGTSTMPGMLTPTQMRALASARGAAFDRLFLTGMIQHHRGALAMVAALQAMPGAAQESSINHFVIEVDTDQRAEIARMRRMLPRR